MDTIYKFERDALGDEPFFARKKTRNIGYRKHWHSYFEIMYYNGCKGVCIINGEAIPITERCLFLLTPKDFHEIQAEDRQDSFSINLSFCEQIVDERLMCKLNLGPFVINDVSDYMVATITELYEVYNGKSAFREELLEKLLNALLIYIFEAGQCVIGHSTEIHPAVQEAILYMLIHPTEEYSLTDIAKNNGISSSYLSRLFHRGAGVSFKQYQLNLRIEHAKRLLEERNKSVLDVCYESGFHTLSQFNRMFKKATGVSPSHWRKIKQKKGRDPV